MQTTDVAANQKSAKGGCNKCKGYHKLAECAEYIKGAPKDKWNIVKKLEVCSSCLQNGTGIATQGGSGVTAQDSKVAELLARSAT